MWKDMAWNTFKKTGDIDTFLEFMKIKDIEQNLEVTNGDNKNQGDSFIRK